MDIEEFLLYLQSYYGNKGRPKKPRGGVTVSNNLRIPIFDSAEGFTRETLPRPMQQQPQMDPMQGAGPGMMPQQMGMSPQMGGMPQEEGDPTMQLMQQLGQLIGGGQ